MKDPRKQEKRVFSDVPKLGINLCLDEPVLAEKASSLNGKSDLIRQKGSTKTKFHVLLFHVTI